MNYRGQRRIKKLGRRTARYTIETPVIKKNFRLLNYLWMDVSMMSPLMRIRGQLFAVSQTAPLLQRQTLADGLARYLGQLGLARRVKVVSINDLLILLRYQSKSLPLPVRLQPDRPRYAYAHSGYVPSASSTGQPLDETICRVATANPASVVAPSLETSSLKVVSPLLKKESSARSLQRTRVRDDQDYLSGRAIVVRSFQSDLLPPTAAIYGLPPGRP
jgi:hypothetical protein